MEKKKKFLIHIVYAALLFFLSLGVRGLLYQDINLRRQGHEFVREGALFVYFAEKDLKGGSLSEKDMAIRQSKGGIVPDRTFSLFSLKVLMKIYKILFGQKSAPLEIFLAKAGHAAASFIPVIVFFLLLRMTGSRSASFFGASLTFLTKASLLRTLAVDYTKEIYALPLIMLSLALTVWAMTEEKDTFMRKASVVLAGAALGCALILWDMTRLYLFVIVSALTYVFFCRGKKVVPSLVYSLIFIPAGLSFVDPYLRSHSYVFFPANSFAVAFLAVAFFSKNETGKKGLKAGLFFLVLFSCILFLIKYNKDYSHFAGLFFYKLKYLNTKPLDSAKLPYEVRLLWTPALHSLSVKSFGEYFLGLVIISIPGLAIAGRKVNRSAVTLLIIINSVFLFFSILFFRVIAFSSLFLSLSAGLSFYCAAAWTKKKLKLFSLALIGLVACNEILGAFSDSFVLKFAENFPYKETRSLTSWIDHYTDKDSVFLANFPLTGSILAYGGRSVVTHPKYEDEDSRKIIRDYISSLFEEGEESFYRFCFENGVDFFVFSKGTYTDRTVYSYRYVAGMEKPLPDREKSPAFLFENSPYRLRYFGLCFENEKYRVFRVITEESIKRSSALFREAMQIFQEDGSSVEGLNVLYGAFLENPQSLAVRILLRGKKKKMKSLLPHVD